MKPSCFDSEYQFEQWNEANQALVAARMKGHFCQDCTPDYAERMRRAGRCDHPEQKFIRGVALYPGATKLPGIRHMKRTNTYVAEKQMGDKRLFLGEYDSEAEAYLAWEAATAKGYAYVTHATESSGDEDEGLSAGGSDGAQHPVRKGRVQERSVRVLRHYLPGTGRSNSRADNEQIEPECTG